MISTQSFHGLCTFVLPSAIPIPLTGRTNVLKMHLERVEPPNPKDPPREPRREKDRLRSNVEEDLEALTRSRQEAIRQRDADYA